MVHLRLNEREPNPNKHINFISPLLAPETPPPYSEEDARQLLRALAAQVRPVMKSHGFAVNSFEEYEYNRVFAGRNWNNGETIELVLRRADGTFVSVPWLLGTLCHELAHIKHMNHGRDFQRLWTQLRLEVSALQERGYFGDGYWSSGTRISDSLRIGGQGVEDYDLPEYICGGAQTRSRPNSIAPRNRRIRQRARPAGPSHHTGAQVPKRRKPGTRVKAKGAFSGEGRALNEDISDEEVKAKGTGFRKQAGSKRAREERALAAERRLKARKGVPVKTEDQNEESLTESDSEYSDHVFDSREVETDETRRQTMRDTIKAEDNEGSEREGLLYTSSQQFMRDFLSRPTGPKDKLDLKDSDFASVFDAIEISDDEEDENEGEGGEGACVIPSTSNPVIPGPSTNSNSNDSRPAKRPRRTSPSPPASGSLQSTAQAGPSRPRPSGPSGKDSKSLRIGRIVEDEMKTRKKEALGLTGGRKLGSSSGSQVRRPVVTEDKPPTPPERGSKDQPEWSCQVCTLDNLPNHLACSACGTPRGEAQWPHQ